jgi:hypothetical protein
MASAQFHLKQTLKFVHELGTVGFMGSFAAYLVLVAVADQKSPAEYAALRAGIAAIAKYILMPSLAMVLITGLASIAVHRPFMEQRWVWVKALLGITVFEGTLGAVGAAQRGADLAAKVAAGEAGMEVMADVLRAERMGAYILLTLALVNVVLAVWRPRLKWRVSPDRRKEKDGQAETV